MIDNADYFVAKGCNVSISLSKGGPSTPLLNVNLTGLYKGHFYVCYFDADLYANEDGSRYVKLMSYYPDPNYSITEIVGTYSKDIPNSKIIDDILEAIKKHI